MARAGMAMIGSGGADVTGDITRHLMKAAELSIAAQGRLTGNYALIAQATVNPDGTFLLNWQRYYSPPQVTSDHGTAENAAGDDDDRHEP